MAIDDLEREDLNECAPPIEPQPPERAPQAQRRAQLQAQLARGRATRARNLAARKAQAAKAAQLVNQTYAEPTGVVAKSVQVRGANLTIKDGAGHVWTVPANEEEDYQFHRSPYAIKHLPGYNPEFDYQWETSTRESDEVANMITEQWYPVSRKELGVPDGGSEISKEYGMPYGEAHRVHTQVLLKKPKLLVERERAAYTRFANTIVEQIAPAKDSAKRKLERQAADAIVTDSIKSATTYREPSQV